MKMKNWTVTLWRGNPQLKNGGYTTTRTIEAGTQRSAWRKAEKEFTSCVYGTMRVINVEEVVS